MENGSHDVDDIRRRMARIRRELHDDVQGVVQSAEEAADWRYWVRHYPWAAVGATFAVGFVGAYFLIPPRRKKITQVVASPDELSKIRRQMVEVAPSAAREEEKARKRGGLIGALFGLVTPIVVRAAQGYASHHLEQWLAQQQWGPEQMPESPEPARGPTTTRTSGDPFGRGSFRG